MSRSLSRVFAFSTVTLALAVFLKLLLVPDPVGNVYLQAQRLEASGQTTRALERYQLIAARHPESSYAPRALMRVGELLATQGRQGHNKGAMRRGVAAYVQLAHNYPKDPFALTALQDAGNLAAQDLGDRPLARGIYQQILKDNGENSEIGAGAIVKLARLSIQDRDGKTAKGLLQEILRKWNNNNAIGSEAQYFLGVCYETVFSKRDWAKRAFNEVVARFPNSQWAGEARARLGLLEFSDLVGRRPTRRVMLSIAPLPDENDGDESNEGAMWNALRLALAARGLSGDPALLRGYSLAPFYAGLNPNTPGEPVDLQSDAWANVAGAAGFRFTIKGGGTQDKALTDLQDDVDAGRLPLVCWQNEGKTVWSLVVGYDSERGEVMLQNRGTQFDTLAAKAWAPQWKIQSPFGKNYTLVALVPGENRATANPKLTPTPAPSPKPGQTPAPVVNGPPTFVWGIAPLKEAVPIGRTANRAGILLLRSGTNTRLLNANALNFLASVFGNAAREARLPDTLPTNTPQPTPTDATDTSIYDPTPTPAAPALAPELPREQLARAQRLWPFWNAPATAWIAKRREAASWCRLANLKTKDARFNRAADLFDQSASALESASQSALALDAGRLKDESSALAAIANQCRRARDAERQAARVLG